MENILEVSKVSKQYQDFKLDDISFVLPKGCIMGVIGANGAGKTTLINSILNTITAEGNVFLFGKNKDELTIHERADIGVVYDENGLPEHLKPTEINKILKHIYPNWKEATYFKLMEQLQIPLHTKVKEMSKGNKTKLNLIAALSHEPKLLILDEVTGTLDPVTREEVLKLMLEFVGDESRSILFSSHITTDLEKIADYITFMNHGHMVFSKEKEDLITNYRIVKCKSKQFDEIDRKDIIAFKKEASFIEVLMKKESLDTLNHEKMIIEIPMIDDIMMIYVKGEMA